MSMCRGIRRLIATSTTIIVLSLISSGLAAERRLFEDFDDQLVNSPLVTREYGEWNISLPTYSWGVGRGGTGYSYGSGDTHDVWVSWERGSDGLSWFTDELYLSYYIRYPSWTSDGDNYWNAKFFYIQERGNSGAWEMDATGNGSSGFFWQIRADGGSVVESGWSSVSNAWDGNWHHYEIYIHRTQGIYRFWYDGNLKINKTYGQKWSTSKYDISICSIDGQTENVFTRFIDAIEVWDGIPVAPDPPQNPRIVVVE
jgi:hypothetical protein